MINNRQNGRRRGRGGPQVRNGSGNNPERGNRIDNRARGNAAQLHEKYRNLARDMQTQGDRVMTEYYLQFADHYFRVLSEGRARFDEQNPNQGQQRRPFPQNDEFDDTGFDGDGNGNEDGMDGDPQQRDQHAFDREPRRQVGYEDGQARHDVRDHRDGQRENGQRENGRQENGGNRENGQGGNRDGGNNRPYAADREQRPPRPQREPYQPRETAPRGADPVVASPFVEGVEGELVRPRRGRPPRRIESTVASGEPQAAQIQIDRLPPAFAPVELATDQKPAQAEAPSGRGRRRTLGKPAGEDVNVVEGKPETAAEPAPRRRRVRRDEPDDSNVAA